MKLLLQGIVWDCPSPSFLSLSEQDYDTAGKHLDISFLGDQWLLSIEEAGDVKTIGFEKRDEAVGYVALAFAQAC